MPSLTNWTGKIFYGCEILEPVDPDKRTCSNNWKIRCYCGKNIFEARPGNLKSGNIKSCKDCKKDRLIDWTGKVFNGCTILEPIDPNKKTGTDKWKIRCHCGNVFDTAIPASLKSGNTTSCDCLKIKAIINFNKTSKKKYNYYNFVNKLGIKILRPVDPEKEGPEDDWIALCPRHDPPKEFIAMPSSIYSDKTNSCGCLQSEQASLTFINYNKQQRLDKGLGEDEYILEKTELIRRMVFDPIRPIVLKIDGYTCNLCLSSDCQLQVHHIVPMNNFLNYSDKDTYKQLYDLNNLITLCKNCHRMAHDYYGSDINLEIQKELQAITSMRSVSKEILNKYNQILQNKITPWIDKYITEYS